MHGTVNVAPLCGVSDALRIYQRNSALHPSLKRRNSARIAPQSCKSSQTDDQKAMSCVIALRVASARFEAASENCAPHARLEVCMLNCVL